MDSFWTQNKLIKLSSWSILYVSTTWTVAVPGLARGNSPSPNGLAPRCFPQLWVTSRKTGHIPVQLMTGFLRVLSRPCQCTQCKNGTALKLCSRNTVKYLFKMCAQCTEMSDFDHLRSVHNHFGDGGGGGCWACRPLKSHWTFDPPLPLQGFKTFYHTP